MFRVVVFRTDPVPDAGHIHGRTGQVVELARDLGGDFTLIISEGVLAPVDHGYPGKLLFRFTAFTGLVAEPPVETKCSQI